MVPVHVSCRNGRSPTGDFGRGAGNGVKRRAREMGSNVEYKYLPNLWRSERKAVRIRWPEKVVGPVEPEWGQNQNEVMS